MSASLFFAVLGGLGGMLGWGLADFFAKKAIDAAGDTVTLVWAHVFGTLVYVVVASITIMYGRPLAFPESAASWSLLAIFGALQAVVYFLAYRGFGKGQVAVLNPIFASFSGLVAVGSVLFLSERMSVALGLVLALLFAGVLCLSLDMPALRKHGLHLAHVPGFREIAGATILAAFWTLTWSVFLYKGDWIVSALLMYVFMTVCMLIYAFLAHTQLTGVPKPIWKYFLLIGAFESLAYLSITLGYSEVSHTSVVALISGAFSLPTVILAHIFLGERTTLLQRIGTVLVIVCVAGIALSKIP